MFAQDIQNNKVKGNGYNFIDLFAGAGGLSEGFFQAGFNPIAHVEMNPYAAQTLETRSCYYYLKKVNNLDLYYDYLRGNISRKDFIRQIPKEVLKTVICETMSKQSLPSIFEKIDTILREDSISQVDVIVGGPPCQAYSLVGRAQSSHMEIPMEQDPRNSLYLLYADFLKRYNPKMFVFENVMGIKSANGGATCLLSRCQCHRDTLPLQSGNVFISATIWPVFFCTQVVQIKKVHSVGWLSLEVLKKWFPS